MGRVCGATDAVSRRACKSVISDLRASLTAILAAGHTSFAMKEQAHKLTRTLALWLLLSFSTAQSQQPQSPTQSQERSAQTGRSYGSGDPSRKPPAPSPQSPSPITFTDSTAKSGITFRHLASPTSQKYLVEAMGGGVA